MSIEKQIYSTEYLGTQLAINTAIMQGHCALSLFAPGASILWAITNTASIVTDQIYDYSRSNKT